MLWIRKSLVPALFALAFSMVIASVGPSSSLPVITQTNSTTTVYLDPPTINATAIGVNNTITVNINIRDAINISDVQIGLAFNPTLLKCTGFSWGEFISDGTLPTPGTIDNTAGLIGVPKPFANSFLGDVSASGSGRLAYVTFRVKAPGISDLHLRDVKVMERVYDPILGYKVPKMVLFNIIDVFTVVVDTTPHTVVTISNSTGKTGNFGSGFSNHAFSLPDKEISFNVSFAGRDPFDPYPSFSNVTIPKTLLEVENLDEWKVIIDGTTVSRTVTSNGTHYSIYFTYGLGIHKVQITNKKELRVSLEAPMWLPPGESSLLNATVYNSGVNARNVTLQLLIDGSIVNSTVIGFLPADLSSDPLTYNWTAPMVEAIYNVTAYAPPLPDDNATDNVATKFVIVGRLFVDPPSGPIGTKVTVYGGNFANQTQVLVTFNDMPIGYAPTDEAGRFTFVFNVPVSAAGIQTVKAMDVYNVSDYEVRMFTVIDVTPLDIEIDVGSIHFRGESAELYVQITFKGTAVDATSISALLHKPDRTTESLTVPPPIATGFYNIIYAIPVDAPNGTYALAIEANYTTSTIKSRGTSFKTFLLSSTLAEELAMIEDLGDEIENLKAEIAALNTTLNSLNQMITQLETDLSAEIAALNTTLNSLNEAITQLETRIDTVKSAQDAFTPPLYAAVALALIAAAGTIVTLIFQRRKPTAK